MNGLACLADAPSQMNRKKRPGASESSLVEPHEQPAAARDGRWFTVRIMPYRTLENMIDGVMITFMDITASKTLERKLRATQAGQEKHIAEQDLKLEQAGEALRAETQRKAGSSDQ